MIFVILTKSQSNKMYRTTSVEDQQKFIVPLNRETEKIWYDQRFIIDAHVLTEPRSFEVSKVNRISPNGLVRITLAENMFDQHNDYIEKDEMGNVVGMWANYHKPRITIGPEDPQPENIRCVISHSGVGENLKVGGGYRKFTVKFYIGENEIDYQQGEWSFELDGQDAYDLVEVKRLDDLSQIKVKFTGDDSYIDKNLVIKFRGLKDIHDEIEMNIVGL